MVPGGEGAVIEFFLRAELCQVATENDEIRFRFEQVRFRDGANQAPVPVAHELRERLDLKAATLGCLEVVLAEQRHDRYRMAIDGMESTRLRDFLRPRGGEGEKSTVGANDVLRDSVDELRFGQPLVEKVRSEQEQGIDRPFPVFLLEGGCDIELGLVAGRVAFWRSRRSHGEE